MDIRQIKTTNNNSQNASQYQFLFPFDQIHWYYGAAKKKLQKSPRDVEARKETRQDVEAVVAIRPNGQRQNLGSTHHGFRQFPARGSHELHLIRHIVCLKWICIQYEPRQHRCEIIHQLQLGCTLHIWLQCESCIALPHTGTVLCALGRWNWIEHQINNKQRDFTAVLDRAIKICFLLSAYDGYCRPKRNIIHRST